MKYSHLLSGVTALAFLTLSGAAFAENSEKNGHHGGYAGKIEKMDVDGDGNVTVEEAKTNAADHFKKMDTDGDGLVTKEEMVTRFKDHRSDKTALSPEKEAKMKSFFDKKFTESDTDGDGSISEAEFVTKSEKHLQKLDVDGDGVIEKEEVDAQMQEMHKKFKEEHKRSGEVDVVSAE